MTAKIAIIGSGPAGFYTAEALLKELDGPQIDIIERYPTPFGLIRYGVAPDNQSIKKVAKRFEKTALSEGVRFLGNVTVGKDVSLDELRELYDAVVLATGAPVDRHLGLPGEDLEGVIGSAEFVGWYNCHPTAVDLNPDLDVEAAAVIGVGNVALDVARILARTAEEMTRTDLPEYAQKKIAASPIKDIYIIGRRGPLEASFTPQELKEFGHLAGAVPLVDAAQLPESADAVSEDERVVKKKNLAILKEYTERKAEEAPVRIHFMFYARPVEIQGTARVESLLLERTRLDDGRVQGTGETWTLPCGLVIPCIGYQGTAIDGAAFDADRGRYKSDKGVIEPGLYAVGWAQRGSSGTIGTNRHDGVAAARHIAANCTPDAAKKGGAGLDRILAQKGARPVAFSEWQIIDAAEQAAAADPAPRRKFTDVAEMLELLEEQKASSASSA